MRRSLVTFLSLALSLVPLSGLAAQEAAPPAAPAAAPDFGFGASLGTEIITEMVDGQLTPVTYQFMTFVPDLALGPFGVGLDVKLNYRFYRFPGDSMGFYVRPADWIVDKDGDARPDSDATVSEWLDLYLSKIVYIRYGQKREALYAKLGLIEDATLGNGFILGNYSNGLLRPETKITGLSFDLDGALFGFPLVGVETFIANLSSLNLVGGRLFVRPLTLLNVPVFKDLQVGLTGVLDGDPLTFYNRIDESTLANPLSAAEVPEGEALVYGVDFFQPLLGLPVMSLALFGDVVNQNNHWGTMVGLGGNLLGFISYGAQARFLGANFIPTYFDRSYDLTRVQRMQVYRSTAEDGIPAYNGWFASAGFNFLDGKIAFSTSLEGPLGSLDSFIDAGTQGSVARALELIAYPKLRSMLHLDGSEILPVPLSVDAFYDKDIIKSFEDLISAENALIGARLNYQAGPAVLSLVYNVKYLPVEQRTNANEPWVITSKLETAIKFF